MTAREKVEYLQTLGFDSSYIDNEDDSIRVRCSQCEACVINGVPCHEHGCPNASKARDDDDYDTDDYYPDADEETDE